jgi:dolichol-phosphate mannosyltransferase
MSQSSLSVVIPVFNEVQGIPELWSRVSAALEALQLDWEVIFVDDGSSDGSVAALREICRANRRARLLLLSRNFGNPAALAAGIEHARGDAVVVMDADLQDRPEAIHRFVEEWKAGSDVVYAIRSARAEGLLMRAAFSVFYWIMARMSSTRVPLDAGTFSLMDRKVCNALKDMTERNRYLPGLRAYAGFRQKGIEIERDARHAGTSRMKLTGLFTYAINGLIAFSYVPIRIATCLGLIVAATAFIYLVTIIYLRLFTDTALLGWASTLVSILFLGSVQLITLGVLGEYIGRIYEESKKRPYYIVSDTVNFDGGQK